MARPRKGSIKRRKTTRGLSYGAEFEVRGQRIYHHIGGDWDGWNETDPHSPRYVPAEVAHLARLIDRGEYVGPRVRRLRRARPQDSERRDLDERDDAQPQRHHARGDPRRTDVRRAPHRGAVRTARQARRPRARPHRRAGHQERRRRASHPHPPGAARAPDRAQDEPPLRPRRPRLPTSTGRRNTQDNVRVHVVNTARERDNELLAADGRAGIAHLTPHTLRRTFASMLAELEVPPRRAMYLLGHADPTLTMRVYQQVTDMGGDAPDQLARLIGSDLDDARTVLSGRGISRTKSERDVSRDSIER